LVPQRWPSCFGDIPGPRSMVAAPWSRRRNQAWRATGFGALGIRGSGLDGDPGLFLAIPPGAIQNMGCGVLNKIGGDMDLNSHNRREFLQLLGTGVGGVVFASGLGQLSGCATPRSKSQTADDFYFLQLSDTHWGFKGPPNPEADVTLKNTV